ncbi:helix-turn-helix domain-containing protein [Streptomyces lichenis]|uniref:Helix-turn-helix domain-containing protein n=1 Tax=Streptomyces lichenis TaxID=2306967 RepID=A0ABT0ID10_9ACTN|nr:helix-turn-helix domain-containing protein [Streptomyces lichenis]MCK8679214.1 helix-turn-helix domain-containing protein [Streptomyces lichenis]
MRYAQGGGLTDAERSTRERLRLRAVERFEGGQKNPEIAGALRISVRSVERWRRAWREGGEAGVFSKGSPGRPRLSEGPGTVVAADVQLFTEAGDCPGEVLVFAQGGYLSWLEVCSWSDDVEVNLAKARRWLQPPS